MMKTAEQQLQRMEALVRKMAAQFTEANGKYGAIGLGSSLAYIDMASYREAVAIVAELPEPVDVGAMAFANELDIMGYKSSAERIRNAPHTYNHIEQAAIAALRRAREEGVK